MSEARRARVRALAKLNLDLRVLGKRADGFHELRSVFQTISLADSLDIAFTPGRATSIELEDTLGIPDNLVERAARAVMEASGARGRVQMRLTKRIPMGAGMGGGSSDAAAVLLALPALTGKPLALDQLCRLGEGLGSDVPFFLLGGRAVGVGRGSELFPLPDSKPKPGLVIAPGVHVSTAGAYAALSPSLTTEAQQNKIFSFQSYAWGSGPAEAAENDFEAVVFAIHPRLRALRKRLERAGASPARMTGSGSALYGLFSSREEVQRALESFSREETFQITLVGRARYRSMWWRALAPHISQSEWPPLSRYVR
jgi:4-diphosphocytidyl-2-C-methyl-D-erythritol kinase